MKEIKLEQGSSEWLSWRRTVITATDASIIMGNNPWTTPYQAWQRKLGLLEEKASNDAMERGKRLEPDARAQFNEDFGPHMTPMVVESSEFDFLGASLDGICPEEKAILEIKCGGAKLHAMARNQEIPAYYLDQMQHQLLVTGAERCFYYSYDGTDGICIEVLPDPKFREDFLPKAREFWRCVALEEAPPLQDKDYLDMSENPDWCSIAPAFKKICEDIKNLEVIKESYRKEFLKLSRNANCLGAGIRVRGDSMKGAVDMKALPDDLKVAVEKYRKAPSTVWKVLIS